MSAVEESSVQTSIQSNEFPPEVLVAQIADGNRKAEEVFYHRYRDGLIIMLEQRTKDRARAEDLAQDALLTVLNRLRESGIEKPASLSSFVHQTAKYLFIGWLRKSANQTELVGSVDEMIEEPTSVEENLEREQTQKRVRRLISEMKVARDREVLYRFYVRDQSKLAICEALDLTPTHFDRVINRARNRFKQLLLQGVAS